MKSSWKRVEKLYNDAVEMPPAERPQFLDEACGDDAVVRQRLESLLSGDNGLLDRLSLDGYLKRGDRLSKYKISKAIGHGGMGIVYLAEQQSPQRLVALKVILGGMPSPELLKRFELEAQILGKLHHPGIAQIYEAGTYSSPYGILPFFAMEYVKGEPLTKYAEVQRLDLSDRLELIAKTADALHHAHQKGVIHRDLKPKNIFVDESAQPKILDFGVARALSSDLQVTTVNTDLGQLIGTVPYMSPEQATGDSGLVDVRSDIYSLGVTSFELLSEELPYDLEGKKVPEALRTIVRDDGRRLGAVNPQCEGDVEIVVAKALSKDKERRYQSAREVAEDIRRYLRKEPITARAPSSLYLLQRFAQRNRALVILLIVVALGAALSSVVAYVATQRYKELVRLADLRRLSDLRTEAATLWPALPENIERFEEWLTAGRALAERLARHESDLKELSRRASGFNRPEGTWEFANVALQWQHDNLRSLIDGLRAFMDADPYVGDFASVEKRLEQAKRLQAIAGTGDSWRMAIEDIQTSPIYEGLRLSPQKGLLPLDRNPVTGLWEFWHPLSGERPVPNPDPTSGNRWRITRDTGLILVLVPGGTVWIGTPKERFSGSLDLPLKEFDLPPFFISKYELTQAQWQRATGTNASQFKAGLDWQGNVITELNPAESMSWDQCDQVLRTLGLTIPTEVQWEYAARGNTLTAWWCGNHQASIAEHRAGNVADAWTKAMGGPGHWTYEAWSDGWCFHAPVGLFAPNPFGLYDVIGNVWEWCYEVFEPQKPYPPPGPLSRVTRGGSFDYASGNARSASRNAKLPYSGSGNLGIRPARPLD